MDPKFIGQFENIDKAATEALWHIDARAEEEGWDQPPALLLVKVKPVGRLEDTEMFLSALDVSLFTGWPAVVERYEDIKDMLSLVVFVMGQFPKELRGPLVDLDHLYGLALVSETWTVNTDTKDKAEVAHLQGRLDAGDRISDMENRVESRMVFLTTMEGHSTMLTHERDGVAKIIAPSQEGAQITGSVPALLTKLIRVIKE